MALQRQIRHGSHLVHGAHQIMQGSAFRWTQTSSLDVSWFAEKEGWTDSSCWLENNPCISGHLKSGQDKKENAEAGAASGCACDLYVSSIAPNEAKHRGQAQSAAAIGTAETKNDLKAIDVGHAKVAQNTIGHPRLRQFNASGSGVGFDELKRRRRRIWGTACRPCL
jgi:hypothetical protein